jgi:hypothetical protein
MKTTLEELGRRYPWPAHRPDVREDWLGWFCEANRDKLAELISPDTKIILELGSFCGLSAKWFCETAPQAVLICIDHWKGSAEHHRCRDWERRLPTLYETFCRNLWPYRERLIPMRTTIHDGLHELHGLGIVPDLIYVDGSHDADSVEHDVSTCLELFPRTELVGDDWPHHSVRTGAVRAAARCKWLYTYKGCCFHIPVDGRDIRQ